MERVKFPKFIIDTDPGIDDALAILMAISAHQRGQIEIVAITLVNGNTDVERGKVNVMRLLETMGMSDVIPVHVGHSRPLIVEEAARNDGQEYSVVGKFHGNDGFNDVQFDDVPDLSKIKSQPACEAMLELASRFPGEIKLVALGPLTNVATCVLANERFLEQLASVDLMGGNTTARGNITVAAEFNFHVDPEAAHVVLSRSKRSRGGLVRIVPWETCRNSYESWTWRTETLGKIDSPQAALMNRLEEKWRKERVFGEQWVQCDQLTMACALDESALESSSTFYGTVELHGRHTRGMLVLEKRGRADIDAVTVHNIEIVNGIRMEVVRDLELKAFGAEDGDGDNAAQVH